MNLTNLRARTLAGVLGTLVLAGGAAGCGASASGDTPAATTATTATSTTNGTAPAGTPPAGLPGRGVAVTGTAAAKAGAAATAKYPGTVEHVEQHGTGYVVHVITSAGEKHVLVSSAYKVTGLEQRPTGAPGAGAPPASTSTSTGATT